MLRIHEQMMQADRQRVEQEEDEGEPAHRVGIEPPASRPRGHGVKGDVAGEEPEIDDRVQRPGEQVRDRPTSTIPLKPSAAGITWNSNSAATPSVVHSHITALATVANIASGTGCRGSRPSTARIATIIRMHQIHDATTTRTSPM